MKQEQKETLEVTDQPSVLDSNRCDEGELGGFRLDWILSPASDLTWGSGAERKTHSAGFVQPILLS